MRTFNVWQNSTFNENNSYPNEIFLETPITIYYYFNLWRVSSDKIKTIAPDIKFIQVLDVFNIIAPNPWLIICALAVSFEKWFEEMFTVIHGQILSRKNFRSRCSPQSLSPE